MEELKYTSENCSLNSYRMEYIAYSILKRRGVSQLLVVEITKPWSAVHDQRDVIQQRQLSAAILIRAITSPTATASPINTDLHHCLMIYAPPNLILIPQFDTVFIATSLVLYFLWV